MTVAAPFPRAPATTSPALSGPLFRTPTVVWACLFANVLTFLGPTPLLPVPTVLGQLVTQGMLVLAVVAALLTNPRVVIRPNLFLLLLSVMAVEAFLVSLHNEFLFGALYRATRLVVFVLVLWMLTPFWGATGMPLLRAHLVVLRVLVASVIVGGVVAPGAAFSEEGRLRGAFWPIPPPQVGHYAAMLVGLTVVLWFCQSVRGRTALLTLVAGGGALLASHTRTALAGMVAGIVVAGASLFMGQARVRRTALMVTVAAILVGTLFAPVLVAWLSRGQSQQDALQLTGRTKVWTAVLQQSRPWSGQLFGDGLSNKSFGGLPIDSNWVATYLDLGWIGIGIDIAMLLALVLVAVTWPRGPRRALALFVVTYCIIASFTEVGLGDASPYLLELAVAASLLATPARRTGVGP